MEANVDDKMIHQIETNLTNNMNDSLFESGLYIENIDDRKSDIEYVEQAVNQPMNQIPSLSRAEYIRLAREACLRQLHSIPDQSRIYEDYGMEEEQATQNISNKKKQRGLGLFQHGSSAHMQTWMGNKLDEHDSPQEIASFRALVIRTVCAIVIFVIIFAIDRLHIEFGEFSSELIRDYVTGNDTLKMLENLLVTWLK